MRALAIPLGGTFAFGAGVVGVWWVTVRTRRGQELDSLAMRGAEEVFSAGLPLARSVRFGVGVPLLAVGALVLVVVAVAGRKWASIPLVTLVIGGANLTTRLLKYRVFDRPQLTDWAWGGYSNIYPSGHTTAVSSLAIAALLVVPRAYLGPAALVGMLATVAVGWSVVLGMHRPGDVIGGLLVAAAWGMGAAAVRAVLASAPGWAATSEPGRGFGLPNPTGVGRPKLPALSLSLLVVIAVIAGIVATVFGLSIAGAAAFPGPRSQLVQAAVAGYATIVTTASILMVAWLATLGRTDPASRFHPPTGKE